MFGEHAETRGREGGGSRSLQESRLVPTRRKWRQSHLWHSAAPFSQELSSSGPGRSNLPFRRSDGQGRCGRRWGPGRRMTASNGDGWPVVKGRGWPASRFSAQAAGGGDLEAEDPGGGGLRPVKTLHRDPSWAATQAPGGCQHRRTGATDGRGEPDAEERPAAGDVKDATLWPLFLPPAD